VEREDRAMQKIPPALVLSPVAGKFPGLGTDWAEFKENSARRRSFAAMVEFRGQFDAGGKQERERDASFYTYRKNENPERETACCWTLEWTKFSQKEKFYIFYLRQDIREYLRELRK
jgi:hypothetical protein